MQELISIKEATDIISDHLPTLGQEQVDLHDAHGRVLAENILADRPIPPFDRVMMDGIAINHQNYANGQREFKIAGTQSAGIPTLTLDDPTQCIEVMTGATLPTGTDCVIKVEELIIKDGIAHLSNSCHPSQGQHIHPTGSDQKEEACLVPTGSLLNAPELAIAASVGHTQLLVSKLPNILLITTGDEVIPPEQSPLPHQIRRSHAPAIRASIKSQQLGQVATKHVPDNPEDLTEALEDALENYDIILLTGGISMGKFDHVAPVMKSLVGTPHFHGVAQRPGKPFAFWTTTIGLDVPSAPQETVGLAVPSAPQEKCKRAVFALPGNPVSVMACLARYVLPALRQMRNENWKPSTHTLAHDTIWNAPFPGLLACQIFNHQIHPAPPRNSGDYTALAGSHGICELPSTTRSGTNLKFYPW